MTNRLIAKEIDGTKDNRNTCHTWDIWREDGNICCHSHSGAEGKDDYSFPEKEGMHIFLCNTSHRKYAYTRNAKFQAFLDKNQINAVVKKDPNGHWIEEEYHYAETRKDGRIRTDGTRQEKFDEFWGDDFQEEHPGTVCYHVKQGVVITGATWVIQERILYTLECVYSLKL